jgi:hypothetical protein
MPNPEREANQEAQGRVWAIVSATFVESRLMSSAHGMSRTKAKAFSMAIMSARLT